MFQSEAKEGQTICQRWERCDQSEPGPGQDLKSSKADAQAGAFPVSQAGALHGSPFHGSLPPSAEAVCMETCQGDNEGIQELLFIYFSIKKLHE